MQQQELRTKKQKKIKNAGLTEVYTIYNGWSPARVGADKNFNNLKEELNFTWNADV